MDALVPLPHRVLLDPQPLRHLSRGIAVEVHEFDQLPLGRSESAQHAFQIDSQIHVGVPCGIAHRAVDEVVPRGLSSAITTIAILEAIVDDAQQVSLVDLPSGVDDLPRAGERVADSILRIVRIFVEALGVTEYAGAGFANQSVERSLGRVRGLPVQRTSPLFPHARWAVDAESNPPTPGGFGVPPGAVLGSLTGSPARIVV